jgi:hypothetical protein
MSINKDVIVKVINHFDEKGDITYRTCVGTIGRVVELRPYTTKTNILVEVFSLVDHTGTVIDYVNKPKEDRLLELNLKDVAPVEMTSKLDIKVGDCFKIIKDKNIFVVCEIEGDMIKAVNYITGKEVKVHKFIVDKLIKIPSIERQWIIKESKTKAGKYLCSHRKYPFKRKYIDMDNFTSRHHELFTWFRDSKKKLVQKDRAGNFCKGVAKKVYKCGNLVKEKQFGNVHETAEWFTELVATRYIETIMARYSSKFEPATNDKYVGIEVECLTKMKHEDLALHLAKHALQNYVRITTDGSLNNEVGYTTVELRVLCKETEYVNIVRKLEKVLADTKCGAKVNNSCGAHVHFDMRGRNVERTYENLCCMQRIIKQMLPKTRRDNQYCRAPRSPFYNEQVDMADHYDAISLTAYKKHKTIEIRYLEGNITSSLFENWIGMWLEFIGAEEINRNYATLETFEKDFKDFKYLDFMKSRIQQFK